MPMPDNTVTLLVGGKAHSGWQRYEIDSDLLIPADAWQLQLGLQDGQLPPAVQPGADVTVMVGRDVVLTGRIDDIDDSISHGSHTLSLSGRDLAATLVDCSAPVFTAKQITLAEVVASVVKPLGIARVQVLAKGGARDKVSIDPGDTAWDVLARAAEAVGLWPWFTPDGTLVVGGPDYSTPPVASLILCRDGKGNNVQSLSRQQSLAARYSDITVLAQAHGTQAEAGRHALKAQVKDPAVTVYRPKIVQDADAENLADTRARARKLLSDSRLQGFTLTATVTGHRTSSGQLWQPGQRVHVLSEPHGIDGVFFLMARKLQGGEGQGTRTVLTLKEDGVWVLDAHPDKRDKKRAKRQKKDDGLNAIDVG